jgi:hypothetical protein
MWVDVDPPFDLAWDQIASRWGLAPAHLPEAVTYPYTVLCAAEGLLELVEVRYRPEGERYVYRLTDPTRRSQEVLADRPPVWDQQTELQALEDLWAALQHSFMDDATE